MSVKWSAHWQFAILGGDHWEIRRNRVPVCLCVTNGVDRSVAWVRFETTSVNLKLPNMPYRQALVWIERNQGESFPSRRT